jgi:mRNA-degrading endonuclease RelE of RelBE toxin-antitoxin system
MVRVIISDKFKRAVSRFKDASLREQIEKLILKICNNPEIGKPMRYERKGTREVYVSSHRLSYHFDIAQQLLTLLDFYHKDKQ